MPGILHVAVAYLSRAWFPYAAAAAIMCPMAAIGALISSLSRTRAERQARRRGGQSL